MQQTPPSTTAVFLIRCIPMYTDILAAALALLSFRGVQILFAIVLPVMAGLGVGYYCAALGLNLSRAAMAGLVLVTLFSGQVLEGIYALQPTLIVATLIGAALVAMRHDKSVLAGALLPVASIKPHLIALLTLWVLL